MAEETKSLKINVPVLTRVEGEGALDIVISNNKIDDLKLRIFEPPRLFEKFLEKRHYTELPDMVARICGICPVAYQISAVLAVEDLAQVEMSDWIKDMRRVYYCGEWIQSHALHIHLLALPDYFGADSVVGLSKKHADEVRRGLKLQALGNRLIALFGGRSVNPVGLKVGGFSTAPDLSMIEKIRQQLDDAENDAIDLLEWICGLEFPKHQQNLQMFSLQEENHYPMMSRKLVGSDGTEFSITSFEDHFKEEQVLHSTALHCRYNSQPYLVGPLARINLNYSKLHERVRAILNKYQCIPPFPNNYYSLVARAAEIYQALLTAKWLLQNYEQPKAPSISVFPENGTARGTAIGCSEAPRGLLWHRYELNDDGTLKSARIVPPTSQNQAQIECDISDTLLHIGLNQNEDTLRQYAEQVIRNYDPCISCATHFLTLKLHHR